MSACTLCGFVLEIHVFISNSSRCWDVIVQGVLPLFPPLKVISRFSPVSRDFRSGSLWKRSVKWYRAVVACEKKERVEAGVSCNRRV